ncbi:MAG: oligosaccharide flippase family protein [Coprococcus sp.]
MCCVLWLPLAVVPKSSKHTLLLIIGATILLNALGVEWLYKALEQYTYITVRSLIFKVVALISTFMLVRDPEDCLQYGFLTILATSASNVLNFINLRKYIYLLKPIGGYHIRRHIKMILVFFSMSVATTIYTNLDNVMLGFMKDKVMFGYYSAAVKIKSIMVSVVTSASTVLLPRASYYVDKGMMDEFSRILKKTMHFIFLVAIPFSIYFMIYAKEGIFFLSGKAYAGAIIPS